MSKTRLTNNTSCKNLSDFLSSPEKFTYVNLNKQGITDEQCISIAEALRDNPTVESLSLSYNEITDEGAKQLAESILIESMLGNTKLQEIHLDNNPIGAIGVNALNTIREHNNTITFKIEDNKIFPQGDEDIEKSWGEGLKSLTREDQKLKFVDDHAELLNISSISTAQAILNALEGPVEISSIPYLEVYNQAVSQKHGLALIGSNGRHELHYSGNNLALHEILCFAQKASNNGAGAQGLSHIKAITLYDNNIKDFDVDYMNSVLGNFYLNLDAFYLHHNQISDDGITHLMSGLLNAPAYRNITAVNLSENQIGDEGAQTIAFYLGRGEMPQLKSLDLHGNQITSIGHTSLLNALKKISQNLVIIFESVNEFTLDTCKQAMKRMLEISNDNDLSTYEILTTDETIVYCKQNADNAELNINTGYLKCSGKNIMVYNYEDIIDEDAATDILGRENQFEGTFSFAYITQNTVLSVVDEDFTSCLLGADNVLNI